VRRPRWGVFFSQPGDKGPLTPRNDLVVESVLGGVLSMSADPSPSWVTAATPAAGAAVPREPGTGQGASLAARDRRFLTAFRVIGPGARSFLGSRTRDPARVEICLRSRLLAPTPTVSSRGSYSRQANRRFLASYWAPKSKAVSRTPARHLRVSLLRATSQLGLGSSS
jgi:hypothetical protein